MPTNRIKKIKIITQDKLHDMAKAKAAEMCTLYKSEVESLINRELERADDIQIINTLARLKRRAAAAWLHVAV